MKILLVRDDTINVDLAKSAAVLNRICKTAKFDFLPEPLTIGSNESSLSFSKDAGSLTEKLQNSEKDVVMFVTRKGYPDNYFYHETNGIMILSFSGWSYYTNLPIENGLFFFAARILTLKIENEFRHEESTGCIYDFLRNKTDVDVAMKMGYVCEKCLERIKDAAREKPELEGIQVDVIEILTAVSNTSKGGKSVFSLSKSSLPVGFDWSTFEDEVSQLYRDLGANVKQDVSLGGFRIDAYVEVESASKQKLRLAVECKFYDKNVGNAIVNDFARKVDALKRTNKIDKGVIVSYSGFSKDASEVSKEKGIQLLEYKNLKRKVEKLRVKSERVAKTSNALMEQRISQMEKKKERLPKIFVVMPFEPQLDDLYFLGIHEVAKKLGCSCERVDQLEFTGVIMQEIYDSIENASAIVAEVTTANLNVYYEVGYAHATKLSTVVLITKDISTAPFDLKGYNHIVYKDIRDLKAKLLPRLKAVLNE